MGQRVNIQYSIDIEKLPEEVNRLFLGAFMKLEEIIKTTKIEEILSLETLKEVDDIRVALADVDYALSDINNIINGYVAFVTQKNTPPEPEIVETEPSNNGEQNNEFEEKLARFKEAMKSVDQDEVAPPG
tara:strand:+ start:768 stop:1157 length:390 start_codon:yes stop_codon:yes gene_type:complete